MIASGISKVNLELNLGEFVVITGDSGSGKTTLLNVISGLDSYEEGEMYIDGSETSHYMTSDFEEYRKKYIGNIFQNYNLINSYTVYQNVELILRINGYKSKDMKARANSIIDRVGLSEFRRTKASKLSGGQKQRVAIARALAKDTDIIVADEPTGNLDTESAQGIVELLSEISKDKLVIVVTHNYDQFAGYATRRIKMHDGRIVENEELQADKAGAPGSEPEEEKSEGFAVRSEATGRISAGSQVRLGVRNTFNIFYKFVLLLIVFLFLIFGITSQYTTYVNQDVEGNELGYNSYFYNYSNDRIVLQKVDKSEFTDDDYSVLKNTANIRAIAPNDILLDQSMYVENKDFSYVAYCHGLGEFKGKLDMGRMPEKDYEVILTGQEDEYSFNRRMLEDVLDKKLKVTFGYDTEKTIVICGVQFEKETNEYAYAGNVYMSDEAIADILTETYNYNSTVTTYLNKTAMEYEEGSSYYRVIPCSKVQKGHVLLSEEADNFYSKGAKGHTIKITAKNIYYKSQVKLTADPLYTKKNFTEKTGFKRYQDYESSVFINRADYNKLFKKGNYQCSVYVDNLKDEDNTVKALKRMGYTTLPLKDAVACIDDDIISLFQVPLAIIILIALFFICYFVTRLILKSRTGYYSILRMLGMARKNTRTILNIEMFVVVLIAFAVFVAIVYMVYAHIINVEYIHNLVEYLKPRDYAILFVIAELMALLISGRFSRKLFAKTAMDAYREEA